MCISCTNMYLCGNFGSVSCRFLHSAMDQSLPVQLSQLYYHAYYGSWSHKKVSAWQRGLARRAADPVRSMTSQTSRLAPDPNTSRKAKEKRKSNDKRRTTEQHQNSTTKRNTTQINNKDLNTKRPCLYHPTTLWK